MTRMIKSSEIKPGMTIRWTHNKVTYECPVMDCDGTDKYGGVLCHVTEMHSQYVHPEVEEVTVVSEPQPEEPTSFGARVMVAGRKIIRVMGDSDDNFAWEGEDSNGGYRSYTWAAICSLGSVTVLPDQSWQLPSDIHEVPGRAEEWDTWDGVPEGVPVVTHGLNCHYRKTDDKNEVFYPLGGEGWSETNFALWELPGPWTRVPSNTITHKNKEKE